MHQQEPLTREELKRLWRRERALTSMHVAAMGILLLAGVAASRYSDAAWFRGLFLAVIGALVVAATILQMMQRCPRCGARLRRKLLVALPETCATCRVALPRPPAGDG